MAGQTSLAIIIRYFQIIDLINNFILKLNIKTPPRLQTLKSWLERLEFPKYGFLESLSVTKDGGNEQVDKYINSKKSESNNTTTFEGS